MSGLARSERARRWAVQGALMLGVGVSLVVAGCRDTKAGDTPEPRAAIPQRLDAVQQGCRTNQPWATDAVCREAAEAIRRRFRGGGVPYTPGHADPFPSRPQPSGASAPARQN